MKLPKNYIKTNDELKEILIQIGFIIQNVKYHLSNANKAYGDFDDIFIYFQGNQIEIEICKEGCIDVRSRTNPQHIIDILTYIS